MTDTDKRHRDTRTDRDRLVRLSKASLRISESLEVDTVLHEVVESACELTGAAAGGIVAVDHTGRAKDFVTYGVRPEEYQKCLDLPIGPRLWETLRQLTQPLRINDLSSHLVSLGFPDVPWLARSFLGVPVRHQGDFIGFFCLTDKSAGETFTDEDEGILVLFASQAGAAIVNARRHSEMQRARADLEVLIDTSPVGVVVFDARSGKLISYNRETQRIVGELLDPGQPTEELLDILSVQRADGREIVLEESDLAEVFKDATAIRAEEIVLVVPDGRKISTLVNATPICTDKGEVETVVVTLQDMTSREDLERMRTQFLGMVSHELRAPLTSIKGCAATALGTSSMLDPAEIRQFFRIIDEQADNMRELIGDLLDAVHIDTGTLSVTPEPVELAIMLDQARNMYLSSGRRSPVIVDLPADLPKVKADRQRVIQVLVNLLSNASRHAPESSTIRVQAVQEDYHVAISVIDEGRGIPEDRLPHLFQKFVQSGREDRGRGVGEGLGLAICKGLVEAHGGRIWAESEVDGLGTRFTFTLPIVEVAKAESEMTSTGSEVTSTGSEVTSAWEKEGKDRTGRQTPCILAVDDDPLALGQIREILKGAGFTPLVTGDPKEVPDLIETRQPDLVLLDLLLPESDGIELMQSEPALADQPVIFLSAYGRDETIVKALEVGAVDYIVKPFSPSELVARIQSALRKHDRAPEPFQSGSLHINYEERKAVLDGRPLKLTATEYDLLRLLSVNAGRVVTHDRLLRSVWRSSKPGDARVVHAFVKKLRQKLGDESSNPTYIFTEHRVGYRMARPDDV